MKAKKSGPPCNQAANQRDASSPTAIKSRAGVSEASTSRPHLSLRSVYYDWPEHSAAVRCAREMPTVMPTRHPSPFYRCEAIECTMVSLVGRGTKIYTPTPRLPTPTPTAA